MPVSTPNRVADPVQLESYDNPTNLKQLVGQFIDWYNDLDDTVLAGEPIVRFGYVCIAQRTILPGKMGILITQWIVDALLDPALAAEITQGDIVYWDYDLNAVKPVGSDTAVAGIGAATNVLPTNGFILGRATANHSKNPVVNGSNELICATTGSLRVQVASVPGAPTTYGTIS